jgi:hypothetical protein
MSQIGFTPLEISNGRPDATSGLIISKEGVS